MNLMKLDNFAIFILSNRRPHNINTINTLEKVGYTGEYYIVVDNLDPTLQDYQDLYGDKVIVFDKKKYMDVCDTIDNFYEDRAVMYGRNACFDIAEELGLEYFMELDDDYVEFAFRFSDEEEKTLYNRIGKELDTTIMEMIKYLENTNALSIAFGQAGDYIGGTSKTSLYGKKMLFKCMNSFLCKTKNRFVFKGTLNEDVNTILYYGQQGQYFLTLNYVSIKQAITQSKSGGLTYLYDNYGTYVKSFYSVITRPDCTKIRLMGKNDFRIHHMINWNKALPKMISDEYKKE